MSAATKEELQTQEKAFGAAAERAHEMGRLEAVRRTEECYKIANLSEFHRV